MEKCCTARPTTDDNIIRRIRIARCIPKATNTHSGYVILIPFPQQQWLHERASVLHYTFIAWLVTLLSPVSSFKRPFGRVYCCSCLVWVLLSYVYLLYCVCIAVFFFYFTLDAGLLTRSQYSEGPATGHLDTGFSWFPSVYKQTLRRFPTFQVATTCFSCSPPDLNLVVTNLIFCIHVK